MDEYSNLINGDLSASLNSIKVYVFISIAITILIIILFSYIKRKRLEKLISKQVKNNLKDMIIRKINDNEYEFVEKEIK